MPAERLYYLDPKQSEFTATVTDIREYARRDGVQVWQIALDRTAFYPTSGGQPHDTGSFRATARSGAELVIIIDDVVEDDDDEVWHVTTKPLLAGTQVHGLIESRRRLDHTQQHSGQHLLSAILHTRYAAPTVSFHLGEVDATIDVAVTDKDAQARLISLLPEVQQYVNEAITSNTLVSARTIPIEEAEALLAAGQLRKLPPRKGDIRLVEIAGLDLNACGGTHVQALGEIGALFVREAERVKQGLRLHFVCGNRAVRAAQQDWQQLSNAAQLLSTRRLAVVPSVERLIEEAKALKKERLQLREELAESHAVQLAVEERSENGLRLVCRIYAARDADYLKLLAAKLLAAVPRTVAILASETEEPAFVLVAANFEGSSGCDQVLKSVLASLGLRGGGTAVLAQARIPSVHLPEITASLVARFTGRSAAAVDLPA
jgi:alanyl-tRNA synthetase